MSTRSTVSSLVLAALCAGAAATRPSATAPVVTPASLVRNYLVFIDKADQRAALALWEKSTPDHARIAAGQTDMMIAVAKLKHAVAARWGEAAPYDLHMAVVGPAECGEVCENISGDNSAVTVKSADPQEALMRTDTYKAVRANGEWLLSPTDEALHSRPESITVEQEQKIARHWIDLIERVSKEVSAGKCARIDDVQQRISNGLGTE